MFLCETHTVPIRFSLVDISMGERSNVMKMIERRMGRKAVNDSKRKWWSEFKEEAKCLLRLINLDSALCSAPTQEWFRIKISEAHIASYKMVILGRDSFVERWIHLAIVLQFIQL